MSKQAFTTSSAVIETDNAVAPRRNYPKTTTEPQGLTQDFLLLCNNDSIAEAIHALYYLPQNYKLIVNGDRSSSQGNIMWVEALNNRIKFEKLDNKEISTQKSPYVFADAIISDESGAVTAESVEVPCVIVSSSANGLTAHGAAGFTVQSGNPEALASAILYIARRR